MDISLKQKLVAAVVVAVAAAGAGGAIAATQLGSPSEESKAIVDDAAKQLGISSSKLSAALKQALKNRVDASVEAGRLTKDQGEALKKRIDANDYPLIFPGPGGFGHHGPHGGFAADLDVAASYLGLTEAELLTQLRNGKSLAEVAKDRGKSVDGLVDVLYDAAKKRLDEAVAAGRLTKEQEQSILADLKQRLTDLVNGKHPGPPDVVPFGGDRFGGDRFGPGFHFRAGPPAFALPTA